MNQTILQSEAIRQGLQARFNLSAAQMYAMIGREAPVRTYRHVVVPCGNNEFSVVDRATDQTKVVCTGIAKATRVAQRRDDAPVATQHPAAQLSPIRLFARGLLSWTLLFTGGLLAFAFFGALP
jgi:hypothetical protein